MSATPASQSGRRGAKAYFAASIVSQFCSLVRYTVLARLLTPEQLGLAATLLLTVQFFQSISDNGSDRFMIQDKDGDAPDVQKLVQSVFVARGAITAVLLLFVAGPISGLLGLPDLGQAFMALAIYPLVGGFLHLDMRRSQRTQDFRTEAWGLGLGEAVGLVATAVAAFITRDFTAIIYGLTARAVVMVSVSHMMANRPYRLGYSNEHAPRLSRFAIPLMLNGVLLFVGAQGERVVIGSHLGFAALGHYTAVLLLILSPAAVLTRVSTAMYLPKLAAEREQPPKKGDAEDRLAGQTLILSLGMAAGFALVAPFAIVILYGQKLAQPAYIVGLIGVLQVSRFIRLWPTTVALASGRSDIVLGNNIVRMVAIPTAMFGAYHLNGLTGIVYGFITGEIMALCACVWMLNRASGHQPLRDFDRIAAFVLGTSCVLGAIMASEQPSMVRLVLLLVGSIIVSGYVLVRESATVHWVLNTAQGVLRKTLKAPSV